VTVVAVTVRCPLFENDDERLFGMKVSPNARSVSASLAVLALVGVLTGCTTAAETASKKLKDEKVAAEKAAQAKADTSQDLAYQKIGKPYQVRGTWYTPKAVKKYSKVGLASWYGPNFHGGHTANGELYNQNHLSAAHKTLPLPSYVRVTNLDNDSSVIVRVNDRGPFVSGRIIDVSKKAAEMLDMTRSGVANVKVDYVGPAPESSDDMDYLLASYKTRADAPEGVDPERFGDASVQVAQLKEEKPETSEQVQAETTETEEATSPATDASAESSATLLAMVENEKAAQPSAAETAANDAVAVVTDDTLFPANAPIPLKK